MQSKHAQTWLVDRVWATSRLQISAYISFWSDCAKLSLISCWLQLCAYNVYRECSHLNLSKQACKEVSQILKLTFLSNGDWFWRAFQRAPKIAMKDILSQTVSLNLISSEKVQQQLKVFLASSLLKFWERCRFYSVSVSVGKTFTRAC